jgi:hypothetical protein
MIPADPARAELLRLALSVFTFYASAALLVSLPLLLFGLVGIPLLAGAHP